jgi:hypothetical protein
MRPAAEAIILKKNEIKKTVSMTGTVLQIMPPHQEFQETGCTVS